MKIMRRELSRRDLMKLGLFGSAALMLPVERMARTQVAMANRIPTSQLPKPFTIPFKTPPVLGTVRKSAATDYYAISQKVNKVQILPGKLTEIWGYNGSVPGPTIVVNKGRKTVVQQVNNLPAVHPTQRYNVWTSTHLHGSASKPQYDGYASDITRSGYWKDYVYPNNQGARTLWYHDHAVHITARNAYMGLNAMYILHDAQELGLAIPQGKYDVPLVIRDAIFETNGNLIYADNDEDGLYGDVILVNGVPWPLMKVERRKYRFRILNASLSRSYEFKLSTGEPLIVVGTDAGITPRPEPVASLKSGMAERYEVVIDFSKYKIGQRVVLQNVSPKNNINFSTTANVMAFDVTGLLANTTPLPSELNPSNATMALTPAEAVKTRRFDFDRANGGWTINGTTWDDVVRSNFQKVLAEPGFNDVEIWELWNPSGGWFHPVHIHLVDFKILDRTPILSGGVLGTPKPPYNYERGPKDTVYLGENEMVRVIMRFDNQQGRFMMHCHNLVHEDHDMMAQFRVGTDSPDYDPISADRPAALPARSLFDRYDDD